MTHSDKIFQFLHDVKHEVDRARIKFPEGKHLLAALMEEMGEVANALLERDYHNGIDEEVWTECVQAAAMCVRVATEGDLSFEYQPPTDEKGQKQND